MLIINSAMQQENIKELLGGVDQDGITYTFKEKKGIQLIFDYTGDGDTAARLAKELIKGTDWGHILYFNVVAQ